MQNNLAYISTLNNGSSITGITGDAQASGGTLSIYNSPTTTGTFWIDPNYYAPYTYPINYYYSYPVTPVEPIYKIKVEQVANGFIIYKNGQKFVVSKPEEIIKYLKDASAK